MKAKGRRGKSTSQISSYNNNTLAEQDSLAWLMHIKDAYLSVRKKRISSPIHSSVGSACTKQVGKVSTPDYEQALPAGREVFIPVGCC